MAFLFSTCRTNFDRRTGRNFMIVLVLQHSRSIIISAITSNFAGQNNIDKKKKKKTKNPRSPPPLEEEIRGERGTKREVHRHFRSSIHQFGKTREILYPTPARTSFLFIHPPPTLGKTVVAAVPLHFYPQRQRTLIAVRDSSRHFFIARPGYAY